MKWILAFVAALVASVWATNEIAQSKAATAKSWSSVLDKKCPRCVPSRLTAKTLPIPLPKRAIVYSFTGEFAHKSDIWLVDLNTGEIIHHEAIANDLYEWKSNGEPSRKC